MLVDVGQLCRAESYGAALHRLELSRGDRHARHQLRPSQHEVLLDDRAVLQAQAPEREARARVQAQRHVQRLPHRPSRRGHCPARCVECTSSACRPDGPFDQPPLVVVEQARVQLREGVRCVRTVRLERAGGSSPDRAPDRRRTRNRAAWPSRETAVIRSLRSARYLPMIGARRRFVSSGTMSSDVMKASLQRVLAPALARGRQPLQRDANGPSRHLDVLAAGWRRSSRR